MFEQMYRASMFYGRKGLPVAVISVIDLAIWDLLGHIRNEPVYKMLGGATRERLNFYCTGPEPAAAKEMGFFGAKVPLPYGPGEGAEGLDLRLVDVADDHVRVEAGVAQQPQPGRRGAGEHEGAVGHVRPRYRRERAQPTDW